MTTPRLGQGMPTNDGWIAGELADLRRQITELRAARTLDASTVSPGGVLTVDGALVASGDTTIGGNLIVNGASTLDGALVLANGATLTASGDIESANYVAGTSGWKLDGSTGNLEINDVTIRGGIIGDDALTDPVRPAVVNSGTITSLNFTTSFATYVTQTVTVPAGFTSAQVLAIPTAVAPASAGGGLVAVYVQAVVNGTTGPLFETLGDDGAFVQAPFAVDLTGLSGSFTLLTQAKAIGNNASCAASMTAIISFQR